MAGPSWHSAQVDGESEKLGWVSGLPAGQPAKDELARLVDEDHDEAETDFYEAVADPEFASIERERRRYRGSFLRRLRRRGEDR